MPDIPKRTECCDYLNCQETDVDNCVRNIILQKDWTTKIYEEDAVNDWKTKSWSGKSEDILLYAVEECRWRREQWQGRVGTPAAICKAGLVLARDDVRQDLRSSIVEDLLVLRQEEDKSTVSLHPKYKKIHHLVHPSLYAYEKGVTHVLQGIEADAVSAPSWETFLGAQGIPNHDKRVRPDTDGSRNHPLYGVPYQHFEVEAPSLAECSSFQWLPSEFFVNSLSSDVDATTSTTKPKCQINSYINNLHPIKYQALYERIGDLFVETLPLMEEALSTVNDSGKVRKQLPRFRSETRNVWFPSTSPAPPKIPEPPIPKFSPLKYTSERKVVHLHDRPLQVIVKLISMDLQPDIEGKPDFDSMTCEELDDYISRERPDHFDGGHWHVEGTHDERIVASACCYLASENVEEDGLKFRDGSVGSEGTELGLVETFPGRILVWPNYLHHKTGKVWLADKKKPGHRTLCCFHLVDPTLRIRSTATVPPQQESWVNEMVDDVLTAKEDIGTACSTMHKRAHIKDRSHINYEEALERRKRLSKERSADFQVIADNFWIPSD